MGGPKRLGDARQHTGDRKIDAIQERIRRTESASNACPFSAGKLRSVQFTNASRIVNHGLGTPAAFFVVRASYIGSTAIASLCEDADQTGLDPNNQIRIHSTTTTLVDLWFYPQSSEVTAQ